VYVAMVLGAQQQLAMAGVTQQLSEEGAALIGLKGKLVDVDGYLDNWKEAATGSGAAVPAGILNPCSWTGIKCSRLNSSVVSLDLSSMSLTGSLSGPDLGQLKNLVNISVDCNNLTGDLPAEIVTLPFLQYINVSNNNFSNYFPSNFSQLQYLQVCKKIIYEFTSLQLPPTLWIIPTLKNLFLSGLELLQGKYLRCMDHVPAAPVEERNHDLFCIVLSSPSEQCNHFLSEEVLCPLTCFSCL